jgi:hypothetical protein
MHMNFTSNLRVILKFPFTNNIQNFLFLFLATIWCDTHARMLNVVTI